MYWSYCNGPDCGLSGVDGGSYNNYLLPSIKIHTYIHMYFESTWIRRFNARSGKTKGGQFPIHKWNVYDNVIHGHHKANNFCEGFKAGFNAMLQAANPTSLKFISDLKLQHGIGMKGINDIVTGIAPAPQHKRA